MYGTLTKLLQTFELEDAPLSSARNTYFGWRNMRGVSFFVLYLSEYQCHGDVENRQGSTTKEGGILVGF